MLFSNSNIQINILSVLELKFNKYNGIATHRPYHALSYRITGDTVFNSKNKSWHVSQNEIVYVPKMFDYELTANKNEHLIVIHFELSNCNFNEIEVFKPYNAKQFDNMFKTINQIWNTKNVGYKFSATSLFYEILKEMLIQYTDKKIYSTSGNLKTVIEYIHKHYTDKNLTIALLADIGNMSETYLRKLFQKNFLCSPLKYINELRIQYALELLKSGYYSIAYIADKSGFSDPKYFSTVIKKAKGTPPSLLLNK